MWRGTHEAFPGGFPSRDSVADGGSLEVMCDTVNAPRVRAGFVRAGFHTIERVADPVIPPKGKIVTLVVRPEDQKFLQMADPAADALCGAGLTAAYPDGKSYSGDLFSDATARVQCDQIDAAVVPAGFCRRMEIAAVELEQGDTTQVKPRSDLLDEIPEFGKFVCHLIRIEISHHCGGFLERDRIHVHSSQSAWRLQDFRPRRS
jgi:hypothetical protein